MGVGVGAYWRVLLWLTATIVHVFRLRLVIGAACVAAVAGLAGCGKDAAKPKATTAAAPSVKVPAFTCPLAVGQVAGVVGVPALVKIATSHDSCQFGIRSTAKDKTSLADPKRPIVYLSLLPVATAAMQASAANANPGATIKARSDLGRQTFEVLSSIQGGAHQVQMVSDAGPASGSWIVSVDIPKSSTAAAEALRHAEDLTSLLRNVKAPAAVVGTDPITTK